MLFQDWIKRAKRIQCPALLPEEPVIPHLAKMLVSAPYKALEKKAKKKEKGAKSGLRRKGTSDMTSGDAETHSSAAEDNEEKEDHSPSEGGGKKRAASTNLEAEASKKGKASLVDNSAWDVDSSPERRPRDKPLAGS